MTPEALRIIASSRSGSAKQFLDRQKLKTTARLAREIARRCPNCKCPRTAVFQTRRNIYGIIRRIACRGCFHRWTEKAAA